MLEAREALVWILFAVLVLLMIIISPLVYEQATSDEQEEPYSGATPDTPMWDILPD